MEKIYISGSGPASQIKRNGFINRLASRFGFGIKSSTSNNTKTVPFEELQILKKQFDDFKSAQHPDGLSAPRKKLMDGRCSYRHGIWNG